MGHFTGSEIDRFDLGDGFWVDIKRRMSYGERQRQIGHLLRLPEQKSGKPDAVDLEFDTGKIFLLTQQIVDWNLVDDQGVKVPVSEDAIKRLDKELGERIAIEIDRRNLPIKKA